MDGYAVRARRRRHRHRGRAGAPAGGRRDRRRPGPAARDVARHRRQDHDRRPGARRAPTRSCPTSGPTAASPRCGSPRRRRVGQHVRRAGEDVSEGDLLDRGRHRPRARATSGCSPRVGRGTVRSRPAAAGGDPVDRLRAARARHAAGPRLDLRRQLLPARRLRPPGRRDRLPGRHRPRRAAGVPRRAQRPAGPGRPGGHQRRRLAGRLRRRQGGAAPLGTVWFGGGRDAARQAAGLRVRRRGPDPDLHAAGQPGVVVHLLRDVRAARAPQDDGQGAVLAPDHRAPGSPTAVLAGRAAAVPARRATSVGRGGPTVVAGRRRRLAPDRRPGRRPTR